MPQPERTPGRPSPSPIDMPAVDPAVIDVEAHPNDGLPARFRGVPPELLPPQMVHRLDRRQENEQRRRELRDDRRLSRLTSVPDERAVAEQLSTETHTLLDAVEQTIEPDAWAKLSADEQAAVTRDALVLVTKLARLALGRLDSAGTALG